MPQYSQRNLPQTLKETTPMAAAILTPKRAKQPTPPGKKTKEEIRGLPPSRKTLSEKAAQRAAAGRLATERADVARADAAKK